MTRREMLSLALASAAEVATSDAFLGDYEGKRAGPARLANVVAQVFPLGHGQYQINFLPVFDQRCPLYASIKGQLEGGRIRFSENGWSGEITSDRITGESPVQEKTVNFELKKVPRLSPTINAKPPGGAVVLFDGKDVSRWEGINQRFETGPILWRPSEGALRPTPVERKPDVMRHITTKDAFTAYRMHIEFRSPLMPEGRGQLRGNSGMVFEDYAYHELQILDSYGLPGYWNDCGAIYNVTAPMVNMCAPPLQWQTYDITYHAPRYDSGLKLKGLARISVDQNGKPIHKDFELPDSEAAEKLRREAPKSRKVGRIRLTYHNDPVEYRNIWLVKL